MAVMDVVGKYRFGLLDLIEAHDRIDHVLRSIDHVLRFTGDSQHLLGIREFVQPLPPIVHYLDWLADSAARSPARAPARTPANP